jgi:hypothetical protein
VEQLTREQQLIVLRQVLEDLRDGPRHPARAEAIRRAERCIAEFEARRGPERTREPQPPPPA